MSQAIQAVVDPEQSATADNVVPLNAFVAEFGESLLAAVQRQIPPVYDDGTRNPLRQAIMDGLSRKPFDAQADVVQAVTQLLVDAGEYAAVINAEMGTGKTMMAIATAAVMYAEGYQRTLVLSPPHLVYKWRREILETVPGAKVWVLNGPDTLVKLLMLRAMLRNGELASNGPEFFILGRVRMRMGFHWRPAYVVRKQHMMVPLDSTDPNSKKVRRTYEYVACPKCGETMRDEEERQITPATFPTEKRMSCQCGERLWTLHRPHKQEPKTQRQLVVDALCQIPTVGPKTAERLVGMFGEQMLSNMLADNVYQFINLMDEEGDLVFSDRQARRMERSLATLEFNFGQGGFQPTEFIKRYLPDGFFSLMVVDEGHEYKNEGSAQGQAMGVLAGKVKKIVLLTGTLMGGYADDLFYLLWRIMPQRMIEDGYRPMRGSLGPAAMSFMREHGILKDVYKETEGGNHKTARGSRVTVHTSKAPGFGPKGIVRFVLPYTAFLKLRDIGGVLPSYKEIYREVAMESEQGSRYASLATTLTQEMRRALRLGDKTLLGVVLNALLAWPDTCFREEVVKHPRTRQLLAFVPHLFEAGEPTPKEQELIELCKAQRAKGRRVLVYTTYTGTRDTATRLQSLLQGAGFKTSVLRASVDTSKREDWILEQVDRGVEVLITNPELVKTGLDLLDFPTIVFMQSGYNVYTLQQAARRSWRIGQKEDVEVYFLGYANTAQTQCLALMAKKIAVSQSTSGDMPETGLDVLNQDGDSIEVALAKQLLEAA